MRTIGIVIVDGIGIRNYLYSDIITLLKQQNIEVILLHSISQNAIVEIENQHSQKIKLKRLPYYKESFREKFLRELIAISRLKFNKKLVQNEAIINNWNPNKKKLKNYIFYTVIEILSFFLTKNYNFILKLERKYQNAIDSSLYDTFFSDLKLDVILNAHQRAVKAVPLIKKAKQLKIKTIGAIFSWDNIPKARLSVRTDLYFVWSEYMKKELLQFYSEINENDIFVTGTPQFEFYLKEDLIENKEDFFEKYHLDSNKKTICFSGDDTRTSPYDPLYLEDLAQAIATMTKENQYQILLRRCPVDVSGRFDKVVDKFPEIIKKAVPLWNFDKSKKNDWTLVYPTYNDVKLLVNTVKHCDVVINVGSTMAHDFAMFHKPAIYINYDVPINQNWSVKRIYKIHHFRSMNTLNPVFWLNNKNLILDTLNKALESDKTSKEIIDGQKWLNLISTDREIASKNITNLLLK